MPLCWRCSLTYDLPQVFDDRRGILDDIDHEHANMNNVILAEQFLWWLFEEIPLLNGNLLGQPRLRWALLRVDIKAMELNVVPIKVLVELEEPNTARTIM